uniref:peptidylprolyl isomerase n=1 Tax=Strigamia maritima TaxID=126957 RepID=T1JI98_STRMM
MQSMITSSIYLLLSCTCVQFVCWAQDELKVTMIYKPEECHRVSRKGDTLSMHYTGTLASDGSQFDSSHVF